MIDRMRVSDLRSEIGEDDFLEVVAMFLEEADEVVLRLVGISDLDAVESNLHFLKGSALNLGLSALAALCQVGEKSAASGQAGLVDLVSITDAYKASRTQLLESLGLSKAA